MSVSRPFVLSSTSMSVSTLLTGPREPQSRTRPEDKEKSIEIHPFPSRPTGMESEWERFLILREEEVLWGTVRQTPGLSQVLLTIHTKVETLEGVMTSEGIVSQKRDGCRQDEFSSGKTNKGKS